LLQALAMTWDETCDFAYLVIAYIAGLLTIILY
jgi:hypothetical protein